MKWLLVFGSASVFILTDYLSYRWSKGGSNWLLGCVCLLGALGYCGFAVVCRYLPLGSTPIVGILVAAGAVLVGFFVFDEGLTWQQKLGLLCVVAAFILLSFHTPKPPP